MIKVNLLVCTLNEARNIQSRLENLRSLYVPVEVDFWIHVLDNGSTDNTCALAEEVGFTPGFPIIVHTLKPIGKCAALFWAFENLQSDYYLLTDANTVFQVDVLQVLFNSIQAHPNSGLFVGNTRSVRSEEMGADFFALRYSELPIRMRIEKRLNLFSGANGACYAVSRQAVDKIWANPAVRNDDFIISVYAATRSSICYLGNAKAYEVENLTVTNIFHQKYRDALGHHQAICWLQRCCIDSVRMWKAVASRLCYWSLPLMAVLFLLTTFGPLLSLIIVFILQIFPRVRDMTVRIAALYIGYISGFIKQPPVRWITLR